VVHGVFEKRGGGEDRQADGRAGEGAGDGEGEASGFAYEGEDAEEFGGHTPGAACQLGGGAGNVGPASLTTLILAIRWLLVGNVDW
jgi:hypothetical protein